MRVLTDAITEKNILCFCQRAFVLVIACPLVLSYLISLITCALKGTECVPAVLLTHSRSGAFIQILADGCRAVTLLHESFLADASERPVAVLTTRVLSTGLLVVSALVQIFTRPESVVDLIACWTLTHVRPRTIDTLHSTSGAVMAARSALVYVVASASCVVQLVARAASEPAEASVRPDLVATFLVGTTHFWPLDALVDVDAVAIIVWPHSPRTLDGVTDARVYVELVSVRASLHDTAKRPGQVAAVPRRAAVVSVHAALVVV
jgi:hypothetical protein